MEQPASNISASSQRIPLQRAESYWLGIIFDNDLQLQNAVKSEFFRQAIADRENRTLSLNLGSNWEQEWEKLYAWLGGSLPGSAKMAVIPSSNPPEHNTLLLMAENIEAINTMAKSFWLVEKINHNPINCYYQSIVDRNRRVFGYESFARMTLDDGKIVNGFDIINASKALNIKHIIDRLLHAEAIRSFAENNLTGSLFINFIPGSIMRPQVYLEGLDDAVKSHNLLAKRVILEISKPSSPSDEEALPKVLEYCHSRGYSVSMDDVTDIESAEYLISRIKPDFVKLDRSFTARLSDQKFAAKLRNFAEFCQSNGCMVLAKSIESEDIYERYYALGINLFQGYLFSKPSPAEVFRE